MIYVEPRAGLCNRMRVIASAYSLAQKYNTKIVVLWRVSRGLNASFYDLFKPIQDIDVKESKHKLSLSFLWYAIKTRKQYWNISLITDSDKMEKELKKGNDIYICTVHQFDNVGNYSIFCPTDSIMKKAEKIIKKITEHTVGIHIRRGDNIKAIERSPIELFTVRMDNMLKEGQDYISFYLATDAVDVQKYMLDRYHEKIISACNIKLDRNSLGGMEEALVDLLVLSKCRLILGSYYSSFSEVAAAWGGKKLCVLDTKRDRITRENRLKKC